MTDAVRHRAAEDHRRAHQAHRGPAPAHRARQLSSTTGRSRACCMSRSAAASMRMRASVSIDCAAARAAPGVVAVLTARRSRARSKPLRRDLAHERLLRDADPAARARQGALCRRAGRRRRRGKPLPRRGRRRADRDRVRAAARRRRSGRGRARRRAAAARGSRHQRLVAREFKRGDVDAAIRGGAGRGSAAASACAARPRSRSSRARVWPNTSRAATRSRCYSATQIPGIVRDALAEALDLPGQRLRVVAPDVGGGFGGKGSLYPEEIFVCAAARAAWPCR